jgi:hypothetical protein
MSENVGRRDPLYLFACHLEWHRRRNRAANQELLAALEDPDADVRCVAEALLDRNSYTVSQPRTLSKHGEVPGPVSGPDGDAQVI